MVDRAITATTRVAAVIGSPVRHSLSPRLHNAAFSATGIDAVYVAFDCVAGGVPAAFEAARTLDLLGLSVTMPAKEAAAVAVDRCSKEAAVLGAVNCVRWDGDELVGENTDGAGFTRALAAETGFVAAGRRCAVVGAGGAARAVIRQLAAEGASEVLVLNRSDTRAAQAAQVAGGCGRVATAAELAGCALVVNATPLGMRPGDSLPVDVDRLDAGAVVADLIYHPAETEWLARARSRGLTTTNGLGMLVHQAALAFELWTGVPAPVEVMRSVV